jgi:hypothetical protein
VYTYVFLVVGAAIVLILALHVRTINEVRKRDRQLRRLEAKLDLLMKDISFEFEPYDAGGSEKSD